MTSELDKQIQLLQNKLDDCNKRLDLYRGEGTEFYLVSKERDDLKAENILLKEVISSADMLIRIELSYAGQFPGGPKDLEHSLKALIEKYRKLVGK